jgi:hypothetical protein
MKLRKLWTKKFLKMFQNYKPFSLSLMMGQNKLDSWNMQYFFQDIICAKHTSLFRLGHCDEGQNI